MMKIGRCRVVLPPVECGQRPLLLWTALKHEEHPFEQCLGVDDSPVVAGLRLRIGVAHQDHPLSLIDRLHDARRNGGFGRAYGSDEEKIDEAKARGDCAPQFATFDLHGIPCFFSATLIRQALVIAIISGSSRGRNAICHNAVGLHHGGTQIHVAGALGAAGPA